MMEIELPKVFGSALEAANAADQLRAAGDQRPLEVLTLSNGQAVLRVNATGERYDNR